MSKKHEFVSTSASSAFLDITGRIDNETRERVREREKEWEKERERVSEREREWKREK